MDDCKRTNAAYKLRRRFRLIAPRRHDQPRTPITHVHNISPFRFRRAAFSSLLAAAALTSVAVAQEEDEWDTFDIEAAQQPGAPAQASAAMASGADESVMKQFPFRRRYIREDVTIHVKDLKLASGKRASLIYGAPKGAKDCPAVFVLDVETTTIANEPRGALYGLSEKKRRELLQAGYLSKSPFGSNLIGNGFAVAYLVSDDLDTLRSARTADWIDAMDRVRRVKSVDSRSYFLFSTREYANLAIYLAAKYEFSGVILEEPNYMLFSAKTYDNVIRRADSLTSEEIWSRTDPSREARYQELLSTIGAPILLIRNPASPSYAFNDKTLIPKLQEANVFVETLEVDGPVRDLEIFGGSEGVIELAPEVAYYPPNTSRLVQGVVNYLRANAATEPLALRDPAHVRTDF